AAADGAVNDEGYLIDDDGEVISDYPVVFQMDLERLYQDSAAYNAALNERQDMNVDFSVAALDLADYGVFDGIYGYVSAPSIGLNIPIYLGAGEYNMACGGAHLYHTSLPLGGESTNTVIAGHTGYFGRTVFDYLPQLSEGDSVSVTTYFDTLDYRVVAKKEITATETNDLYISKGKDMLTLITCARMGKSRYEVICERVI
nr:class C sortase [Ruminococcus sp.]